MSKKPTLLDYLIFYMQKAKAVAWQSFGTAKFAAVAVLQRALNMQVWVRQTYTIECVDRHGKLKWSNTVHNLVVDEGLTDMLEIYYRSSAHTSQHYVLITDADPVFAPGDTMADHPGWTEFTEYSEATRPPLVMSPAANKSIDNSANKASFSINTDAQTTGGAGVTDDNAKGGATGLLVGGGVYDKGNKPVDDGDTILVTVLATNSST